MPEENILSECWTVLSVNSPVGAVTDVRGQTLASILGTDLPQGEGPQAKARPTQ